MSQMVVMVMNPTDAAKMILLGDPKQETDEEGTPHTRSWMTWAPELSKWIARVANNPVNEVEEIIFVGPKDYVEPFMERAKTMTNKPVSRMG